MFTTTVQRAILMAAFCLVFTITTGYAAKLTGSTQQSAKIIYDLVIDSKMKSSDLDKSNGPLKDLIKFLVKGSKSASNYVSFITNSKIPKVRLAIDDSSIFSPEGKSQKGFRRTDWVTAMNDTRGAFSGTTTFYQTIQFDSSAKLSLTHQYLLASVETPGGDHLWDIVAGNLFDSKNPKPKEDAKIRVRDFKTKSLFEVPLDFSDSYNFAITLNSKAKTLAVYASTKQAPLKKVVAAAKNDVKQLSAADFAKTEYHIQLVKFPLPDIKLPPNQINDVPHFGTQESGIKEAVFFSNVYATSGTEIVPRSFAETTQPQSKSRSTPGKIKRSNEVKP